MTRSSTPPTSSVRSTVRLAALLHAHVPLLGRLESLQLGGDRVDARLDEVEDVVAVGVGDAVTATPVASLVNAIVAPGSAAWLSSVTLPCRRPR